MTYAGFLLLFLLVPLAILIAILRRRLLDKRYLAILGALTLVSLIYMAPWDHLAAVWGLWTWAITRTWGLRWWAIPPEEYLFCVLEALLAITLTFAILTRKEASGIPGISPSQNKVRKTETNHPSSYESANMDDISLPPTTTDQESLS